MEPRPGYPHLGVTYLGNRFPAHAARDLEEIAEVCDYVVHTLSESDMAFHRSALEKIFTLSRKKGLEIWADPWGLGRVFGGEAFSNYLAQKRGCWQVLSDGRFVPKACLNRPELVHFLREWVLVARDLGAQVILWDEPHFHWDVDAELRGVYSCACPHCQKLFEKRFRQPMPKRLTLEVQAFRLESLRNFMTEITGFAHAKKLRNAVCIYAISGVPAYEKLWEEASSLPDLDIFGCDPYWRMAGQAGPPEKRVSSFSRKTVDSARRHLKNSQIWIQAMKLRAGQEEEIVTAVREAARAGTDYIAAWSYDGGELLDTVLSENPGAVWKAVKKAYLEIKNGRTRAKSRK